MDWTAIKLNILNFSKKYRFVILVLLAGICLLLLPEEEQPESEPVTLQATQETDTDTLEHILSKIKGAGKVEVLLTEYKGRETLYQTDSQQSGDSYREDTVILSGTDREKTGLIRQINPPIYQGALIVCQGGDSPTVKLAIVEAVMDVTGLSSDRITVLKMK